MKILLTILVLGCLVLHAAEGPRMLVPVLQSARCPKCESKNLRLDSFALITNVITHGVSAPRGEIERYEFKCKSCGEKFRRLEVLAPLPPTPQKP